MGAITAAQVDATNTVPPGDPAAVNLNVSAGTLHFTFNIPQGATGSDGGEGPQGPMGEISNMDLQNAIAGTSNNSNGVGALGMTLSDPPSQGEVQAVADKLDELINALRR